MSGSVLLVEDEENLASLVGAYLEQEGYRVIPVATGADALRAIEAEPVRLVVLDLNLPDMDGLDVCRQIRARSSVPVVMLTARDEEADRLAGLETGADDYLMQNRGAVLSRDLLLERVWGFDYAGGTRTVDVHVAQLRRKLGRPDLIRTMRGSGYKAVQP